MDPQELQPPKLHDITHEPPEQLCEVCGLAPEHMASATVAPALFLHVTVRGCVQLNSQESQFPVLHDVTHKSLAQPCEVAGLVSVHKESATATSRTLLHVTDRVWVQLAAQELQLSMFHDVVHEFPVQLCDVVGLGLAPHSASLIVAPILFLHSTTRVWRQLDPQVPQFVELQDTGQKPPVQLCEVAGLLSEHRQSSTMAPVLDRHVTDRDWVQLDSHAFQLVEFQEYVSQTASISSRRGQAQTEFVH